MRREFLRTVRLHPYLKGRGPYFTLTLFDTRRRPEGAFGRCELAYRMHQVENGKSVCLFVGAEYWLGAGTSIDSDDSIAGLLGFLTLRPGDTDDDYFDDYTPAQLEYCDQHAEALAMESMDLFGEPEQ